MISDKLKKERKARHESRLNMYRACVDCVGRVFSQGRHKILDITDQTMSDKTYTNFAGHISSDITMLMRINDETAFRSAVAKLRVIQQDGDNYGDMSNEEIALHIKPRDVQTLSDFDRWQKALNDHDFERLSPRFTNPDVPPVEFKAE